MGIVEQLVALIAALAELQEKLSDAQIALEVATKEAYDKGFVDGVASVPVVGAEKIYSEEELQVKIQEALLPLNEKIATLEVEIALVPEKIAAGVALMKAELLAKYEELQVAETAAEVGFAELLK